MPEKKKSTAGEKYDEAAGALMRAIDARRSGNGPYYDRLGEYASKQPGSPGELLPPYRENFARSVQFDDYTHPGYVEDRAFSRRREAPVSRTDITAMRELFERPGERPQMGVDQGTRDASILPSLPDRVRSDEEIQFWRDLMRTAGPQKPSTKKGK